MAIRTKQSWRVHARKVIIATNGFAKILLPKLGVLPARNQILLTKPIPGTGHQRYVSTTITVITISETSTSGYCLGGGRNLARDKESTYEFGTTPLIRAALTQNSRKAHPARAQNSRSTVGGAASWGWATTKCPSSDKSMITSYVAAKLGGMGVAIGNLVGADVAELALETL